MTVPATDQDRDAADRSLVLSLQAAPYPRAALQVSGLMWVLAAVAAGLSVVGWVFYGPLVVIQTMAGLVVAALTEWLCSWVTDRFSIGSLAHSLAMGLIVVLMLPPGPTLWTGVVAAGIGVAAGVGVGKWLMGGLGHYPWHPAIVGIIALYMLWPGAVTPQRWPLLARDHILVGDGLELRPLQEVPVLLDWSQAVPAHDAIGFALPRAETVLRRAAQGADGSANGGGKESSAAGPVAQAVRDLLPSGWDMLTGAVPGPIGQGSTLAIVAAGLVLIWRGYLHWAVPLSAVAGAAVAAAILPAGEAGWLPVRYLVDQQPVGLIWAGYQVLLGSTVFAAVMLAGETVTSPLTNRGQMVYGFGVGVLTVALRWWPTAMLAGCWAVLAMNMLVPVIDWLDRRWRIGRGG